jgi:hypothetical protein
MAEVDSPSGFVDGSKRVCGLAVCSLCMSEIGVENGSRCATHSSPGEETSEKVPASGKGSSKQTVSLQFHPATTSLSSKSHKSSAIWAYFAHFDPTFHPDKKNFRICLVCHGKGIDKQLSVGDKASTAPLETHLAVHPEENQQYMALKVAATAKKETTAKQASSGTQQLTLAQHFVPMNTIKARFKDAFAKWVVDECLPLSIGESASYKGMIRVANAKLHVPDRKNLKKSLFVQKELAMSKMKSYLTKKFYSLTLDHWTSVANENYAALTLHLIDNFEMKRMVLSCVKHSGGSSAAAMDEQLAADLTSWGLEEKCFVALVTDTASNMNLLGKLMEEKYPATKHHYCADHNLQLTAIKAYTGDIALRMYDEAPLGEGQTQNLVGALKKARDLVSHVSQSPMSKAKLDDAQKRVSPDKMTLTLIQDVKTRWWSTYMMLERILVLKHPIKDMFRQEF